MPIRLIIIFPTVIVEIMVRAVKGWFVRIDNNCNNSNQDAGILVECDPSIKAIINKIDEDQHDFVIEDLGDEAVLVKESKLKELQTKLNEVRIRLNCIRYNHAVLTLRIDSGRFTNSTRRSRIGLRFGELHIISYYSTNNYKPSISPVSAGHYDMPCLSSVPWV